MTDTHDAVIVGSGVNALVAGALLARDGWSVAMCERNELPGGAICTREDVFPGYTVELLSSWHPLSLGSPAYAEHADELASRGVTYLNTDLPTGVVCADGTAVLSSDETDTAAEFDRLGDGTSWRALMADFGGKADLAFGLLGTDFWRRKSLKFGWTTTRRLGRRGLIASGAELRETSAAWLERALSSPARALLAPWPLHNGPGPDDAGSAFITKGIVAAVAMGAMPVPAGGGRRLVDALAGVVTDHGGTVLTGAHVDQIAVIARRATGVRLHDGRRLGARRAVLASVTPGVLYDGMLSQGSARGPAPGGGRLPAWTGSYADPRRALRTAPVDEPEPGSSGVAARARQRGLTVRFGQRGLAWALASPADDRGRTAVRGDPSRVPEGAGLLWLQLQELPRTVRGDLAGEIARGDGSWSPKMCDAYAERVLALLAPHIANLRSAEVRRRILGPAELEALDVNLVGFDPYGGDCRVDQFAAWRPLGTATGHSTGIEGLWHIGASTHPGPRLGGGSGYLVASRLRDQQRHRARFRPSSLQGWHRGDVPGRGVLERSSQEVERNVDG